MPEDDVPVPDVPHPGPPPPPDAEPRLHDAYKIALEAYWQCVNVDRPRAIKRRASRKYRKENRYPDLRTSHKKRLPLAPPKQAALLEQGRTVPHPAAAPAAATGQAPPSFLSPRATPGQSALQQPNLAEVLPSGSAVRQLPTGINWDTYLSATDRWTGLLELRGVRALPDGSEQLVIYHKERCEEVTGWWTIKKDRDMSWDDNNAFRMQLMKSLTRRYPKPTGPTAYDAVSDKAFDELILQIKASTGSDRSNCIKKMPAPRDGRPDPERWSVRVDAPIRRGGSKVVFSHVCATEGEARARLYKFLMDSNLHRREVPAERQVDVDDDDDDDDDELVVVDEDDDNDLVVVEDEDEVWEVDRRLARRESRGQGRKKRAASAAPSSIGQYTRQKRRRRNEEPPPAAEDEAPSPEVEEEVEVEGEELEMDEVRVKVEGERAKEVTVTAVDEVEVEAAPEEDPESQEGHCGWGVLDPEALVGTRVRVWWEGNGRWFSGKVHRYNAATWEHLVLYDDADRKWYVLGTGATTSGDDGVPRWQFEHRTSTDVQENVDEWHELPLRCALSHAPLTDPARASGCAHLSRCNYAPLRAHVARHHTCPCIGCGATMPRTRDVLRDETLAAQLSKLPPGTKSVWLRGGEVRIESASNGSASAAETIVLA